MIIILKPKTERKVIDELIVKIKDTGVQVHESKGENYYVLGLVGDTSRLTPEQFEGYDCVERSMRVQHPFKLASKLFHPEDTVINIEGVKIGGGNAAIIAGPCSIESEEQLLTIAKSVKESGANILRGGAYKPRSSPYSFQGMEIEGLKLLKKAKELTGLLTITEAICLDSIEHVAEYTDLIQIGARNMQNFALLKKAGKLNKPVVLKRGLSATMEEWLMAAEYIMSEGNSQVILCERGIRTFETYTRNTLDISAVPMIKEISHLPIIVDPSHAAGKWSMVEPLSKAAMAVGADGIMVEVHHQPENALSDGAQSLKPEKFKKLMENLAKMGL
ncbi:3-deoxy-D-arabinoheptulosonate-7-phosphate synthase [Natranaerovirga pectinivora]|uniref:3-deoxy-D-arabinoheptulosonate-7-phosphate synthase n=1 Tax=Natranaerovirga pectinivora TaxID=682400 RepID=A0A4V2UZQ7_9FIRM|nr:3-deoxy-7-phosphoheptulonate synthase [Natranaerovirga pectinivora]TCT12172.1 3-deoxy-D-arabinoheptulosonate-7-phosphate synthase [Natranaerovirga pectinivora]